MKGKGNCLLERNSIMFAQVKGSFCFATRSAPQKRWKGFTIFSGCLGVVLQILPVQCKVPCRTSDARHSKSANSTSPIWFCTIVITIMDCLLNTIHKGHQYRIWYRRVGQGGVCSLHHNIRRHQEAIKRDLWQNLMFISYFRPFKATSCSSLPSPRPNTRHGWDKIPTFSADRIRWLPLSRNNSSNNSKPCFLSCSNMPRPVANSDFADANRQHHSGPTRIETSRTILQLLSFHLKWVEQFFNPVPNHLVIIF